MTVALLCAALAGAWPSLLRADGAAGLQAGERGQTVSGTVINARTLEPLADVRVTIVELARDARTSPEGRFLFTNVPAGDYTLAVSTIGFIFVRRPIVVAGSSPIEIAVPLAEGAGTYRESVTVSASPTEDAGATKDLSESQLQDLRGVMADDPVRALQALPGVAAGADFRSDFSVRGAAFRQIGTVIDGTPTAQLFHTLGGGADAGSISMINTDVLTSASLTAGPHARKDGDWLGATVTFDIREGSRDRTAARLAVSGTSTSAVAEGPLGRGKRGSWLVSLRKSYIGWLVKKIDPSIEGTFGFADTQIKAVYDLTSRQQVQFVGVGGTANFFREGAANANSVRRSSSQSALTSASWRYARTHVLLQQRVSFVVSRITNIGSSLQQQVYNRDTSLIWRGDGTVPIGRGWTLDGGLQAGRERVREILHNYRSLPGGGFVPAAVLAFDNRRTWASGWGQIERQTRAGHIALGARETADRRTGDAFTSSWITAEQRVAGFTLFAGVDRTGQLPTLDNIGLASTTLIPERAWQTEAGFSHRVVAGVRAKVSAFYRDDAAVLRGASEDRLVNGARVVSSTFPDFASTLDARTQGVDVVLERRGKKGPTGWFGYTWAHTRDRDTVTREEFDGDCDQRHTVNVFVEQRMSYRMKVSAKFRYGSNYPLSGYLEGTPMDLRLSSIRNGVRLPAYARLDLSGSRTFAFLRARLTLFVELVNVTGRANFSATDGVIRNNLTTTDFVQDLIPFVPSAGFLIEF